MALFGRGDTSVDQADETGSRGFSFGAGVLGPLGLIAILMEMFT